MELKNVLLCVFKNKIRLTLILEALIYKRFVSIIMMQINIFHLNLKASIYQQHSQRERFPSTFPNASYFRILWKSSQIFSA